MEPVVVVIGGHVLGAGDDEVLVVAEPEAVQDDGIEPVYDHPEGVGGKGAAPEGAATIDITHQQAEEDAEDGHGDHLLDIEAHSPRPIAGIDQAELITPLDDGRRVVEDGLDGVPGHQELEQREQGARDEGLEEECHR